MRIEQADVQLSAHTEQFSSTATIAKARPPHTMGHNRIGHFDNLLRNFNRPAPRPTRLLHPHQQQALSAAQHKLLQQFQLPTLQPLTSSRTSYASYSAQTSLDSENNQYATSSQMNLRVDFSRISLSPHPPLHRRPHLLPLRHDLYQISQNHESLDFAGTGQVQTEDGRTINFDFSLSQDQSVTQVSHASYTDEAMVMIDPLILDLDGEGIDLSEEFLFDLDSDGIIDRISVPGMGAGFLAYDQNDDGEINDGSELFGATTGDGFGELSQYDLDGNNWIDENDAIYGDLSIWAMDDSGIMALSSLQDQEIGAIFLGSVATPISILSQTGERIGMMQESGVYLTESGEARTLHQVDIASQTV